MTTIRSRSIRAACTGVFIALAMASVVWACSSQPRLFNLSTRDAPAGSEVRVTGQAVAPQGVVEVRWNGVGGPLLAQTTADYTGSFSALVRVPDTAPGVYMILAVAGSSGVARSAFEVTASAPPPGAATVLNAPQSDSPWRALSDSEATAQLPGPSSPGLMAGAGLLAAGAAGLSLATVVALRRRPVAARTK